MCVCARAHYAYRHTPTFSITETCGWQTDWVGTETEALQPGRHIQRRDAPRTGAEGGSAQFLADEPWPSKRSSSMGKPRGNDQTKDAQADDQKELLQAGSAESGGAVDARASGESGYTESAVDRLKRVLDTQPRNVTATEWYDGEIVPLAGDVVGRNPATVEAITGSKGGEEEVELDPDTMMPIQKGLFVVGEDCEEEEEEEELDPDTMMPIKKKRGPKPPPPREFVSYRARKLTGWTAPAGARIIFDDDEEDLDKGDTRSEASILTHASAFDVPRNDQHSVDLRRRTDHVMQEKNNAYVLGGNKQRGGLESFEGHVRARRRAADQTATAGAKASGSGGAGAPDGAEDTKEAGARRSEAASGALEKAFEEGWDDAVEGVSRVFRYPTQVEW